MTLIALLALTSTHALDTNYRQPLQIQSDSSRYNYPKQLNYFDGHVHVDQGVTHLLADRLITKNNPQHKIEEAIAYGDESLAQYWTLPKRGEPPVHAQAKIIRFFTHNSLIILEGDVELTQGKNTFKGQLITYNMHDQIITVPPSESGQATIIYTPK